MLAGMTGISAGALPSSYQIIGHVMLLKFLKISGITQKKKIANAILETFPYVKTVCEIGKIEGEFRVPKVKKLAGDGTVTVHKEHGILYKLDAAKIMFSKGNLFERRRLVEKIKPNETVVDMFAGIGYFSLPIAKRAKEVIAMEKNPLSFKYLLENIGLNKIKNVSPVFSDNREVPIENIADRVIMGYFPDTQKFLPFALKLLKKNGIIHFHNSYNKVDLWGKPMAQIKRALAGTDYEITGKKCVKSTAPGKYHVVIDIKVKNNSIINSCFSM